MAFSNLYKKTGCTSVKDISWKKIETNCKLAVPIMVQSSTTKKLAKVNKFDVFVDADQNAGKGRVVLKNTGGEDISIEFVIGATKEKLKAISSVKAAVSAFGSLNARYLKEITEIRDEVKALKDEIKKLEGNVPKFVSSRHRITIKKATELIENKLKNCLKRGTEKQKAHDTWYLAGPRKGIDPLIKKQNLLPSDIDAKNTKLFSSALAKMSTDANAVKKVYDVGIKSAVPALLTRLENLIETTTKSHEAALVSIEKNVSERLDVVKQVVAKATAEAKLEKTFNLIVDLKKADSKASKRLAANPKFINNERESNNTRLANIPKYLELCRKEINRTKKGVPSEFAQEGKIPDLFKQMDEQLVQITKDMTSAKATLEKGNAALDEFEQSL